MKLNGKKIIINEVIFIDLTDAELEFNINGNQFLLNFKTKIPAGGTSIKPLKNNAGYTLFNAHGMVKNGEFSFNTIGGSSFHVNMHGSQVTFQHNGLNNSKTTPNLFELHVLIIEK